MYTFKIEAKQSDIDGKGVFALEDIPCDAVVWKYEPTHDLCFTNEAYKKMDGEQRKELDHSAYLSPWTGLWVCPPLDDPARYTNHSNTNNLSVKFDANVSPEPFFVANRDIAIGEEISNNYREFDNMTLSTKPKWAN